MTLSLGVCLALGYAVGIAVLLTLIWRAHPDHRPARALRPLPVPRTPDVGPAGRSRASSVGEAAAPGALPPGRPLDSNPPTDRAARSGARP